MNQSADGPIRVLFVSPQNSVRSQIAEALLGRKRNDRFEVASAGTDPAHTLHPLTVRELPDEKLHHLALKGSVDDLGSAE